MSPLVVWDHDAQQWVGAGTPPAGTGPAITTTTLGALTVGTPMSVTLAVTGTAPVALTVTGGALPAGLTRTGATISGTPTAPGAWSVTITATNAHGSSSRTFSGTVAGAGAALQARMDKGYGWTHAEAQARTGIARWGLTTADLTEWTGGEVIPAGANLDKVWFRQAIDVHLGGITLNRCLIRPESGGGGLAAVRTSSFFAASNSYGPPQGRVQLIDCEVSGSAMSTAAQQGWTWGIDGYADAIGCDVHHLGAGMSTRFTTGAGWDQTIESCYIHDLVSTGDGSTTGNHVDGYTIRDYPAGANRHIQFAKNWVWTETGNATGCFFVQAWSNVENVDIEDSLFQGNAWLMPLEGNGGGSGSWFRNWRLRRNRFHSVGGYGAIAQGSNVENPQISQDNYRYAPANPPTYAGTPV